MGLGAAKLQEIMSDDQMLAFAARLEQVIKYGYGRVAVIVDNGHLKFTEVLITLELPKAEKKTGKYDHLSEEL